MLFTFIVFAKTRVTKRFRATKRGIQHRGILTLSLPESVIETFKVVLTFESVDAVVWCDYSNKTSSAVLSQGTIYI